MTTMTTMTAARGLLLPLLLLPGVDCFLAPFGKVHPTPDLSSFIRKKFHLFRLLLPSLVRSVPFFGPSLSILKFLLLAWGDLQFLAPHRPPVAAPWSRTSTVLAPGKGEVPGSYSWTEKIQEVEVRVPVPATTQPRDVDCVIKPQHLCLRLAGGSEPLIDGPLRGKVTTDGSYWSMET